MPKLKTYTAMVHMKVYAQETVSVNATSKSEAIEMFNEICENPEFDKGMDNHTFDPDLVSYGIEGSYIIEENYIPDDEIPKEFQKMAGNPFQLQLVVDNG